MAETTPKSGPKRPQKSKKTRAATPAPAKTGTKAAATSKVGKVGWAGRAGRAVAVIGLVVLLAGGGYFWHQGAQNTRVENDEQRDRINARVNALRERLDKDEKSFNERVEEIRGEAQAQQDAATAHREKILRDVQVLSDAVAALRAEFGRSVDRWSLEEVERLMVIANQRLQLAADTELAGNALKLADSRLRKLVDADPALGPVRKMLADEIASLDNVATVDVAGTLNALSALSRSVDDLPLAGDVAGNVKGTVADSAAAADEEEAAAESSSADPADDSSLWAAGKNFLADLGALVQVERDDKSLAPILSVELRLMVFEKTKLILESCQLAFLRKQGREQGRERGDVYASRMEAAKNWVTANFDTESAAVDAWLERWAVLAAVSPETELPDISASLRALREVTVK